MGKATSVATIMAKEEQLRTTILVATNLTLCEASMVGLACKTEDPLQEATCLVVE